MSGQLPLIKMPVQPEDNISLTFNYI